MMQSGRVGRPRSEEARTAVLRAVDDLLLDVGYAAMTMKGIAESAGVSRQTVYRWWATKAEILLEASAADAQEELALEPGPGEEPEDLLTRYLELLARFLTRSPAGSAYRALLGEAQHDPAVATLLRTTDVLGVGARRVVERALPDLADPALDPAVARLVGPTFFWVLTGRDPGELRPRDLARAFLREAEGLTGPTRRAAPRGG